jgi:hypothetical protein
MVAPLQRNAPSDSRLIGIAWTNNRKARNRTQTGKLLYRLMGGSVLSQRNAVVGEKNNFCGLRVDNIGGNLCLWV